MVLKSTKNPLNLTEDDYIKAFENNAKDGVDYTTVHCGITKDIAKRILKVSTIWWSCE